MKHKIIFILILFCIIACEYKACEYKTNRLLDIDPNCIYINFDSDPKGECTKFKFKTKSIKPAPQKQIIFYINDKQEIFALDPNGIETKIYSPTWKDKEFEDELSKEHNNFFITLHRELGL